MTAGQVLDQLREKGLTIGFSTVYRQLDRLVEEGAVNKYTVDAVAGACYEYKGEHGADPAFVHGKCEKCGKLIHMHCDELEGIAAHLKEHHRFILNPMRTVFYGICDQCAKTEKESQK
jgi:Fur family ferric uptake transcriptional regulator